MRLLSEYYTEQAKQRSRPSDNPLLFLDYCAAKTAEETSRARTVLPDTSWDAVQATTERSLLLDHLEWLADGGGRDPPSTCVRLRKRSLSDRAAYRKK